MKYTIQIELLLSFSGNIYVYLYMQVYMSIYLSESIHPSINLSLYSYISKRKESLYLCIRH